MLITCIDQFVWRRIMCHTDRVTSHHFQDLYLTLCRAVICNRTKRALIMMHTYSLKFHLLTIQSESIVFIKCKVAETIICLVCINCSTVHKDFCFHSIEIWSCCTPKLYAWCCKICRYVFWLTFFYSNCLLWLKRSNCLLCRSVFRIDRMFYFYRCIPLGFIYNSCFYFHRNIVSIYMLFQIRCLNLCSVLIYMNCIGYNKVYVSVNTASWVKTAWRCLVIYFNGNHVFFSELHIICNIEREWCVSIRMCTELFTVYINSCIHVHAAEVDTDTFALKALIYSKAFPVPSCTARKISTLSIHWTVIFLVDTVIMRQVHLIPWGVVKCRSLRSACVS